MKVIVDAFEDAPPVETSSSAKLSLAISELVARTLGGESLDMQLEGERLAARYPDLGLSGERIGSAIIRAVEMVGAIRGSEADHVQGIAAAAGNGVDPAAPDEGPAASVAALAEVIRPSRDPILLQQAIAEEASAPSDLANDERYVSGGGTEAGPAMLPRLARGPVAAVRRALFRS